MTRIAATVALSAIFAAQPAWAEDYIFKGDCARARIIAAERTVDKLLPYRTYAGVQRARFGNDNCGRDTAIAYRLRETQRSSSRIVYSLERWNLYIGESTSCPTLDLSRDIFGSVTFTVSQRQDGDICEVYLWSDWDQRNPSGSYTGKFANRVTPIDDHSFVIKQSAPDDGRYLTPLSFVGAP